jgi:hypothetical protein
MESIGSNKTWHASRSRVGNFSSLWDPKSSLDLIDLDTAGVSGERATGRVGDCVEDIDVERVIEPTLEKDGAAMESGCYGS